jgi:glycosyltransferase involved in cell wall biosynthesis
VNQAQHGAIPGRSGDEALAARSAEAPSFSLIICVHNGARRLPLTLQALAGLSYRGHWEVIVVDNASSDDSAVVAAQLGKALPNLRIIAEPNPGLWNARLKGIAEATCEFVVFVDDDNLLAPNYLEIAGSILRTNGDIDLLNGRSILYPLASVPDWFAQVQHCFAVGEQLAASGDVPPGATLWGAGLVVRRKAFEALRCMGFEPWLVGRAGKKMLAGDDAELCLALALTGSKAYYSTEMVLRHAIDPGKLDLQVLQRMAEGFGQMWIVITLYRTFTDSRLRRVLKRNTLTLAAGLMVRVANASMRRLLNPGDLQAKVDFWQYSTAVRTLLADSAYPRRILSAPFLQKGGKLHEG